MVFAEQSSEREKEVKKKMAKTKATTGSSTSEADTGGWVLFSDKRQESESGKGFLWFILQAATLLVAARIAYTIRLYAIEEYGLVIHEFDPWFNYRATEVSYWLSLLDLLFYTTTY